MMNYSLIYNNTKYKVLVHKLTSSSLWKPIYDINSHVMITDDDIPTFVYYSYHTKILDFDSLKELDNLQETHPELFI